MTRLISRLVIGLALASVGIVVLASLGQPSASRAEEPLAGNAALPKPISRIFVPAISKPSVPDASTPTPTPTCQSPVITDYPIIESVDPFWADPGAEFRINGYGFGSSLAAVSVNTTGWWHDVPAQVVAVTCTQITARVPISSYGFHFDRMGVSVNVTVGGHKSNEKTLGIQNKPFAPPDIDLAIAPNNSSVGDTIQVTGEGFSSDPTKNVINFGGPGGASAVTTAYTDYGDNKHGIVTVQIPAGALTGPVTANRLDGLASEWGQGQQFSVVSPTIVTLSGTDDSKGILDPYLPNWGSAGRAYAHELVFEGTNFSKLRSGMSVRLVTANGTWEGQAYPESDTRVTVYINYGEWNRQANVLIGLAVGSPVRVQLSGVELNNNGIRSSNEVVIPFGGQPILGGIWVVESDLGISGSTGTGTTVEIPRGDWMCIQLRDGDAGPQQLRAAPLWSGAQSFPGRCFIMDTVQTFQLTNETNGKSKTIVVKYGGVRSNDDVNNHVDTEQWAVSSSLAQDGVTFGFGGARLIVPPGALPLHGSVPGAESPGDYAILGEHLPSTAVLFDPEQTDGGSSFRIYFRYGNFGYPLTQLLKPLQLVLPYDDAGRGSPPKVSILDSSSGIYLQLDTVVDSINRTATVTIPAGTYGAASSATEAGAADASGPIGTMPTALPLNSALSNVAATSTKSVPCQTKVDPGGFFAVEYTCDPNSSDYATDAYAQEVLDAAVATRNKLTSENWKPLGLGYSITIRNKGPWTPDKGIAGSTTKGVFGQPWTYINNQVPSGPHLKATVAHEIGHGFQRLYTTNIFTKWIDEATAGWVAQETFTSQADLSGTITQGGSFVEQTIPPTFSTGYSKEEENYGACAFAIWMNWKYPGSVLKIYQNYSDDTYATLNTATGAGVSTLIRDFAVDFWTQNYDPLKTLVLPWRNKGKYYDAAGFTASQTLPPLSTTAWVVQPTDAYRATAAQRDAVVRTSGLTATEEIHVYGSAAASGDPIGTPTLLATLDSIHKSVSVGKVGNYKTHRIVAVNRAIGAQTFPFTFIIPTITSVTFEEPKAGGYLVSIAGSGFGTKQGTVSVGAAVTAWSDSVVQFTMPSQGSTGSINIFLTTSEDFGVGAQTNAVTFTLN